MSPEPAENLSCLSLDLEQGWDSETITRDRLRVEGHVNVEFRVHVHARVVLAPSPVPEPHDFEPYQFCAILECPTRASPDN